MKNIVEKLIDRTGSSRNLAYRLIDVGMPYDDEEEADKLAALIRKWKQKGQVPKKWKEYIKKVAENLDIQWLDEKDKKLLKCSFINFLKEIKISYYEDRKINNKQFLIFFIFMLILDKEFVSESIEKEWKNLIELEENI